MLIRTKDDFELLQRENQVASVPEMIAELMALKGDVDDVYLDIFEDIIFDCLTERDD